LICIALVFCALSPRILLNGIAAYCGAVSLDLCLIQTKFLRVSGVRLCNGQISSGLLAAVRRSWRD